MKLQIVKVREYKGDNRVIMNTEWSGTLYDEIVSKIKDEITLNELTTPTNVAYIEVDLEKQSLVSLGIFTTTDSIDVPPKEEFVDWQ